MLFFGRKKGEIEAAPVPIPRAADGVAAYLVPLVKTVKEDWETPDAEQYDHAYRRYLEEILEPIEDMQDALDEKQLLFSLKLQRMIEIAPDLFDKALRRHSLETGYFIERNDT